MVQWPEPNRPGFVAFEYDDRTGSVGYPEDEAYYDFEHVERAMREVLTHPGNHFGVIDQFGVTLQFCVNDDGTIRIDLPNQERQASLVKDASLAECVALVLGAGPSLRELAIEGLRWEPWDGAA